MPSSVEMSSSTRRLSEVARRLVVPPAAVKTGWPDIEAVCLKLGTRFDRWQSDAGAAMFSKTADGKYAATIGGIGMSLPRQVGKTHLVGYSMFALCIIHPGLTVIWTAQHARTADETLKAMQGMARRESVAPWVDRVAVANGDECVYFRNGSRILFGAREYGFGRGFAGVDVLVFDEAQKLKDKALDAMLATMNAAENPLAFYMGTPPTPEDVAGGWSDVFTRMRAEAWSGESEDTVWIECGADPGANPSDKEQWAKANPSYPHRTPLTAMMRMRKQLRPESWLREGLGIWVEDGVDVFAGTWPFLIGERPAELTPSVLAVAAGIDQTHASITAAAVHGDRVHVRSLQYGPGVGWLVDAAKLWSDRFGGVPVVVDTRGPASQLVANFEFAGVDLIRYSTDDVCNAAAGIAQLVSDGLLVHRGDPELDRAVRDAVKRPIGDRWAWGRRKSAGDISPLEGVTLAAWEAAHPAEPPNVFTARRVEKTLVVGPRAAEWASAHAPGAEVVAGMQPWERDRYRAKHDARVVVVSDGYAGFRPSKYGKEEVVTIGAG